MAKILTSLKKIRKRIPSVRDLTRAVKQRDHELNLEIEDGTNLNNKDSDTSLAKLLDGSLGLSGNSIGPNAITMPPKTQDFQASNKSETPVVDSELIPEKAGVETVSSQEKSVQDDNHSLVNALMKEVRDLELEVKSLQRDAETQTELLNSVLNQNTTLNYEKRELEKTLNDCQTRCRLLERKSDEANKTCEIVIKQNEQNNKDRGKLQMSLFALSEEKERVQRENELLKSKPTESRISCGICFEQGDSTTEWQAISVCGHVFCAPCINRLEVQNGKKKCPTCRFEFQDYERIKVFF